MRAPWGSGRFERVLVYGLGLSGRAAAKLLLARDVSVVAVCARAPALSVRSANTLAIDVVRTFQLMAVSSFAKPL